MNTSASSLPKILSKITRADLGITLPRLDDVLEDGDREGKKKLDERIKKWAHVYDIGGRVARFRPTKGKGDKDGIQFLGEFKAHLAEHLGGAWFVSGRAHVPGMFEEMLYAQLVEAQREDEKATIEFLIRVGIKPPKPGKPSAVGYEWTVEPLIDADRAVDPLQALFDKAGQRALPSQAAQPAAISDKKAAAGG